MLQGHVENDIWTGKDGVEHFDLRLIVSDIGLKNRRAEAGSKTGAGEPGKADERQVQEPTSGYDLNDDIPF